MEIQMPEENEKKKEGEKKITVGSSLTISSSVTVILIRGDARKELDKLPKDDRQKILDEAIKISKEKGRPYDITFEDVVEAERRKEEST
jgi:hypothetical protein